MSNELDKYGGDSFDGYSNEVVGGRAEYVSRPAYIYYDIKRNIWALVQDNEPIPSIDLVLGKQERRVVRSGIKDNGERGIVERQVIEPGEPWPDIDDWNRLLKNEWYDYFGKRIGPWGKQVGLFFFDPRTLDRYTWNARMATYNHAVCVDDVLGKVLDMRRLKRLAVFAVVRLTNKFRWDNYGGRLGPHIEPIDWKTFDDGTTQVAPPPKSAPAIENKLTSKVDAAITAAAPSNEKLSAIKASKTAQAEKIRSRSFAVGDSVPTPSLRDELNDELPDSLK